MHLDTENGRCASSKLTSERTVGRASRLSFANYLTGSSQTVVVQVQSKILVEVDTDDGGMCGLPKASLEVLTGSQLVLWDFSQIFSSKSWSSSMTVVLIDYNNIVNKKKRQLIGCHNVHV